MKLWDIESVCVSECVCVCVSEREREMWCGVWCVCVCVFACSSLEVVPMSAPTSLDGTSLPQLQICLLLHFFNKFRQDPYNLQLYNASLSKAFIELTSERPWLYNGMFR